jgi:hypothetical protein
MSYPLNILPPPLLTFQHSLTSQHPSLSYPYPLLTRSSLSFSPYRYSVVPCGLSTRSKASKMRIFASQSPMRMVPDPPSSCLVSAVLCGVVWCGVVLLEGVYSTVCCAVLCCAVLFLGMYSEVCSALLYSGLYSVSYSVLCCKVY